MLCVHPDNLDEEDSRADQIACHQMNVQIIKCLEIVGTAAAQNVGRPENRSYFFFIRNEFSIRSLK